MSFAGSDGGTHDTAPQITFVVSIMVHSQAMSHLMSHDKDTSKVQAFIDCTGSGSSTHSLDRGVSSDSVEALPVEIVTESVG